MKNSDTLTPLTAYEFCRRIYVPELKSPSDAIKLKANIDSSVGVRAVVTDIDKQQIVVCYDVTKTGYEMVIRTLDECGFSISNNWWSRSKMGWFRFTESNARENAKAPPPTCCNKPPK